MAGSPLIAHDTDFHIEAAATLPEHRLKVLPKCGRVSLWTTRGWRTGHWQLHQRFGVGCIGIVPGRPQAMNEGLRNGSSAPILDLSR